MPKRLALPVFCSDPLSSVAYATEQTMLPQEVWGPNYETETNYLRVYLAQLRRKLEPDPSHPRYLMTEPGLGYRFVSG